MTTETARKGQGIWAALSVLGFFAALCTIFVLIVTAAQAWQERTQQQWPRADAKVQTCAVKLYRHKPESYVIECRITYLVHGEEIATRVHSRSTPAPRLVLSKHPAMQIELMEDWVNQHPPGTPMAVRYDPANDKKAVLVATDMPLGGARTPDNVRLLEVVAGSCVLLLALARITKPRYSSS